MDQYNYGGIPAKSDESLKLTLYQAGILLSTCQRKSKQDHFIVIVSQFLYIPWSYAQKQTGIRESMLNGDSCTPSINIGAAEALESEMIVYIKEQISSYFTDNLLRILRYIVLHIKGASKSEDDPSTSSGLPQIVGDQHRGDASLEFIKHVCAVLALDQSVQHDVLVIIVFPSYIC
ncbi:DNA polymerase epsilon catalytic subunit A [Arachis hypogaea]|uniref:DNA polymerase epsilon catalytic subunit A n=2 Tax=Arachis TaxID=3817 RepID=UPI0034E6CDDF|nr:DNA polymerase epsilon catalytic subunit B [Arachis hypogaea]